MVGKSFHCNLISGTGRNFLSVYGGVTFQIGLGFYIHRHGINIDIGPFWIGFEW